MLWKEIQLTALQKMFAAEGESIQYTDSTQREYLAAMPAAANEAVQLLLAAGFAPRRSVALEKQAGRTAVIDLAAAAPDLYRAEPLELYAPGADGLPRPVRGAALAGGLLLLPAALAGPVTLVYQAQPAPFTAASPAEAELCLPGGAERLLPLYIASELYKEDDAGLATQYRNEFEAALAVLPAPVDGLQEGVFISEKGWC